MQKEENHFHARNHDEVLAEFGSTISGLTEEKVRALRLKYGSNLIPEKKQKSKIIIFLEQFKSLMVYILAIAAGISLFLNRRIDAYIIVGIIIADAVIGYFQEAKAESAVHALKKMIVQRAKVYRSAELVEIPAEELVPGDIIVLEEGDRIPADARLIEVKEFCTVESSLTGESLPIDKITKRLPEKTILADRKNMVWLGTFVAAGTARAVVTATGSSTTIGKLARSIQQIPRRRSHFQEKTDILAKQMAVISFIGALIIFFIGYFVRKIPLSEVLLFGIANFIAGIPEGMPAILATVLALGAYRMAKRNAIIRNKYAIETLSIVDTIITDKTGTLTQNTMMVQEIILPGQKNIKVSGEGYIPQGQFFQQGKSIVPLENKQLAKLLHISSYCNNARLIKKEKTNGNKNEFSHEIIGDPTEAALVVLAEKAGIQKEILLEREKRIDEMPFNSVLKYRASLSVLAEKNSGREIYVVGAPEAVIKHSSWIMKNGRKAKFTAADLKQLNENIDALTKQAMRVIAVAYRETDGTKDVLHEEDAANLILVGVVGMSDPPRPEVKEAILRARMAGIRVIMATGDHINTAIAIAKQIGLVEEKETAKFAFSGAELSEMSDEEFERALSNASVFARLNPDMKLKIARKLQTRGHIVAVTGDGVNDAPALTQADIGISMGKTGTDVARESSEIVLADDNFVSIINAIEEGRTVFVNTRNTSFFLLTTGFAGQATIVATMTLGTPLPLLPIQILWLNVVTGGVTDVALSTEPVHHDILMEKPRKKDENILSREVIPYIILLTIMMVVLTLATFEIYLPRGIGVARTAAFVVMSFTQIFNMFNMRSLRYSFFTLGPLTNRYVAAAFVFSTALLLAVIYIPALHPVFGFTLLPLFELFVLFFISSSVLWAGEIYKAFKRTKANLTSSDKRIPWPIAFIFE